MRGKGFVSIFCAFILCLTDVLVWAQPSQFPENPTFTTLITTPRAIEGLTGDVSGNLYTGGSGTSPCPVWKINLTNPSLIPVGFIPSSLTASCAFTGIAFNDVGDLFAADGVAGRIYTFTPNASSPPNATIFASGIPGTNGVALDRDGNLWTSDGTTGQGRVWKISGAGANCTPPSPIVNCQGVFRIQPMANDVNLINGVGGVGRDVRTLPPGTITVTPTSRNAANILGSQPLVANGIAFNHQGDMFVIDTARGALWKVQFDRQGNLNSPVGCDSTFAPSTLCLSNVFVAHPILEGGDGIALDNAGNIWADANERNAVAVVTKDGRVTEVFRNPVNTAGLRNSADSSVRNSHILEFPTSPFINGKIFCTANSDGDRRDNSPRSAGEVDGGGAGQRGKISCMDQELIVPGLPLPVH
jgi:sugar lactone lactonase YvrE